MEDLGDAASRLDPTANNLSSAWTAPPPGQTAPETTAELEEREAAPFLPDEVLQALARDPPPLSTATAARSTHSGTSSARQSIAFDRTFLMDVPGLATPAQRDSQSMRGGNSSRSAQSTGRVSPSSPVTSPRWTNVATSHERRKTLRGLVSNRVRLSTLGPGSLADNALVAAQPAPNPRSRQSRLKAPEYASAWSRIAMAASAPALERSMSASSTQSTPLASTASITSTSSSRMMRSRTADGKLNLGDQGPVRSPGTAPTVDDTDLDRALADLDLRAPLRQADRDSRAPRQQVPFPQPNEPSHASLEPSSDSRGDFLVVVTGPRGVGKSTLIRRTFKRSGETLRTLQRSDAGAEAVMSSASFTMAGIRRTIDIISLDAELLESDPARGTSWPAEVPQAEAVMLCYDASDPDALLGLSTLLQTFWSGGADVPLIVLACKSSEHDAIDPEAAAELCNRYGAGIVRLDGGAEDPQRKAKESFSWLIRQIMDNRGHFPFQLSSRPETKLIERSGRAGETHFYASLATPAESGPREHYFPSPPPQPPIELSPAQASIGDAEPTIRLSVTETSPVAIAPRPEKRPSFARRNLLFSSEDLVDKFLFASIAGDDDDFVNAFLITFRRFVRPARVLEQLVERFDFVSRQDSNPMLKRYGQLRLCSTLSTWIQFYPGDFSEADALGVLRPFVSYTLTSSDWLQHYAFELAPLLPGLAHGSDPDLCWSTPLPPPGAPRATPFLRTTETAATAFDVSLSSAAGSSDALSLDSRGSSTGASSAPVSRQVSAVSAMLVDASNVTSEMRAEDIAVQITRLAWRTWAGITVSLRVGGRR